MRYIYPQLAVAVPSPPDLIPPSVPEHVESLSDLLRRREESNKNRARYHLTEADCDLICSNSKELKFSSGQVIAVEGAVVQSVFRIKCGKISLVKGGQKMIDLPRGHFIGEGLFILGEAEDFFKASLVANGNVIVSEINLPFVRQLMSVDKVLAFKIYRHIASKLSAVLFAVLPLGNHCPCTPYLSRGRSDSTWSNSSDGSDLESSSELSSDVVPTSRSNSVSSSDSVVISVSTSSSNSSSYGDAVPTISISSPNTISSSLTISNGHALPTIAHSSSVPVFSPAHINSLSIFAHYNSEPDLTPGIYSSAELMRERSHRKTKGCKLVSPKDRAFKKYMLYDKNAGGYVELYNTKIVVGSSSILIPKKTIKYNKILDMAKAAKNSVTIIYGVHAKTLFLKDSTEVDEFFGLVNSLISNTSNVPRSPSISQAHALRASQDPTEIAEDKQVIMKLATRQECVKGDVIIAEGDLYQRVYTVVSGQLHMKLGGKVMITIEEGEVFGVVTLFHLRPYVISIEVASDTASLIIIPAYKINELISSNFPLAVRIHKKAAQVVYGQIEKILQSKGGVVHGYTPHGVFV